MNFFGVGPAEAGVILVIALIVIGPQRFPEIMRQAGRWYRVARAYSNEVMKDVRAAVDEIEQEVKAEAEDFREVRELTGLKADLKEARESVEEVQSDTKAAAQTGDPATQKAAEKAVEKSSPPKSAPDSSSKASDGGSVRPSRIKAAKEKAADPPASYYDGRDPSTYDPFKAKEARDRERSAPKAEPATDAESTNGKP